MRDSLNTFVSFLFDMVALPRPTERAVRMLSIQRLQQLSRPDGTLPYHSREVRALVWELKYHANARAAALAGEFLNEHLLAEAAEHMGRPLLIPIPIHPERRRERGFNQTEVLCEAALKALGTISVESPIKKVLGGSQTIFSAGFDYVPDILERVRHTAPQQGLMRNKRLRNVKNSMQIQDRARVKGRVCIVVDDVSTTGATLEEAARALKRAGAASVVGVALAQS